MGITQSTIMALKLLVLVALAAYKCDALPTATDLVVPEANTISSDQKQTTFYEKQTTYDIVDDNAQTDQTGDRLLEIEGGCTNTPNWHDADGATYNCAWYSQGSNCASYGNSYAGVAGQTANQACCACQTSGSEAQTPTPQPWQQPAPACPATCHGGQTCDSVILSMPDYFTCSDLEVHSGCDFTGCTCPTPQPTPPPTPEPTAPAIPVRLVNGANDMQGRVEVWHSGSWGTVCDDGWTNANAQVVCRQLGHEGQGIAKAFQGVTTWQGEAHTWGEGTGSIHYDDVVCTGSEDSLASCPAKHGSSNCGHVEDAGVDCGATAPTEAPTEAPGHGFGSGFGEGSGSGGAQPTPQPTEAYAAGSGVPTPQPTEGAGTPPAWMNEIAADYPAAATAANTANHAEAAMMQ